MIMIRYVHKHLYTCTVLVKLIIKQQCLPLSITHTATGQGFSTAFASEPRMDIGHQVGTQNGSVQSKQTNLIHITTNYRQNNMQNYFLHIVLPMQFGVW